MCDCLKKKIPSFYVFLLAFVLCGVDLFSKSLIDNNIEIGASYALIENIISITKIFNAGAAFSLLANQTIFLVILTSIAIFILLYYFLIKNKSENILIVLGCGFILGGTLGNFVDRVTIGAVLDFIKLDFIDFPIFNLADIFINIGAIIVIVYIIFENSLKNEQN